MLVLYHSILGDASNDSDCNLNPITLCQCSVKSPPFLVHVYTLKNLEMNDFQSMTLTNIKFVKCLLIVQGVVQYGC